MDGSIKNHLNRHIRSYGVSGHQGAFGLCLAVPCPWSELRVFILQQYYFGGLHDKCNGQLPYSNRVTFGGHDL